METGKGKTFVRTIELNKVRVHILLFIAKNRVRFFFAFYVKLLLNRVWKPIFYLENEDSWKL